MITNTTLQNPDHPFRDASISDLGKRLARLQRDLLTQPKSMVVIIEGWESSGRGRVMRDLARELDPRYLRVREMDELTPADRNYLPIRPHFQSLPPYGQWVILSHSLYNDLLQDPDMAPEDQGRILQNIRFFEDLLTADGTLVLKFFLHQSKATMADRIARLKANPDRDYLAGFRDDHQVENYETYQTHFSKTLTATQRTRLPWHIVSSEDYEDASRLVLGTVIESLQRHLQMPPKGEPPALPPRTQDPLGALDLTASLSKEDYQAQIRDLQEEAGGLAAQLFKKKIPILMVFEGTDASGKGGAIRRLTRLIDPRLYHIATTAAPDFREKSFHYLWRFYRDYPTRGRMTIFDRSWYGRVLVERIEGFAPVARWHEAFEEIRTMEKLLVEEGTLLIKFLLIIDKEEQKKRFENRLEDPDKAYKLTEEDWRNHAKFDDYTEAMKDMLAQTHTTTAPWTLVSGQNKRYARIAVLKHFIQAAKDHLDHHTSS